MALGLTLFEKIWNQHVVADTEGEDTLLYIDRHFIHEGSRRAFSNLAERGLAVRQPNRTFATADHHVATIGDVTDPAQRAMIDTLRANTQAASIEAYGEGDPRQGIVHVIGPELGLTLPGMTIVCGDSHTATHGALGAIAFGIGASEVAHVLATQTIWQRRPKLMRIVVDGLLAPDVHSKDLILAIIGQIGVSGATGHAIEFAGSAIEALSVEARLTICNMSIEAGARFGLIAPDATTLAYLKGRPHAPAGAAWDEAAERWRQLHSDPGASFDREVRLDAADIQPMATWGTSPQDVMELGGHVPQLADIDNPASREALANALEYMGLEEGMAMSDIRFDRVYIGSCTNARIEDLRIAASLINGRRVAIPSMVVPGSNMVKAQAEREGLDKIFLDAGVEWRRTGCSMCSGMNGEVVPPGERCASTTNRNFVGRQGPGARTHLMSPATAAAVALTGHLPRPENS